MAMAAQRKLACSFALVNLLTFSDESRGRAGGFIPAETLVHNAAAADNGSAEGTLNKPVLGLLVG